MFTIVELTQEDRRVCVHTRDAGTRRVCNARPHGQLSDTHTRITRTRCIYNFFCRSSLFLSSFSLASSHSLARPRSFSFCLSHSLPLSAFSPSLSSSLFFASRLLALAGSGITETRFLFLFLVRNLPEAAWPRPPPPTAPSLLLLPSSVTNHPRPATPFHLPPSATQHPYEPGPANALFCIISFLQKYADANPQG